MVFAVSMSAVMVLTIMEPGVISQAIAGKMPDGSDITTTTSIMFALFWLVPMTLAVLTLTLPAAINRPANIVLGLLASVLWATDFLEGHPFGGASLMIIAVVIAGLLISWFAWKWPTSGRGMPTPSN
ncbi:MAG TPA: hypothetical protein VF937_06060 [Chloroflexota bacterium]